VMTGLIKYFSQRTMLVNVIMVFVLMCGVITYQKIPREGYPLVDEPGVTLNTSFPGASPIDVELNVLIPIEEAIKNLTGIKSVRSKAYENYCNTFVIFEQSVKDMDKLKQEIRRSLDAITTFPSGVDIRPKMFEWGAKHVEILQVGVSSEALDELTLHRKIKKLQKKLKRSSFIAKVEIEGIRKLEIRYLYCVYP